MSTDTPSSDPVTITQQMKIGLRVLEERRRRREGEHSHGNHHDHVTEGIQIPYPYPYPFPVPPVEEKKKDIMKRLEGIAIETSLPYSGKPLLLNEKNDELMGTNISYPLTPHVPKKGEKIYASVNLRWLNGAIRYLVAEPPLESGDLDIIKKVKAELEEALDVDFSKLGDIKAKEILKEEIQKILAAMENVSFERIDTLTYYIERDLLCMGKLQPFLNDPSIEDISCDGIGIPLYVFHRDPQFGSIRSNVAFDSADELNAFVSILAQKCNKSISIAEPLLDGALPDGSRIQATLGTDIARKGSNFTIRKFTEKPLTPTHMLKYKTLDSTQLAYLWLAVENGKSILVSGGTATGKTSLLNALSLFIRPGLKVVSIEDTSELRLPLPHWIPHVARTPLSIKGDIGEVTLFDLLKTSLRQRPDYIIVGEVRGREAFVLFQQMATGHSAMATIHAASIPQLVDRLITPPISLPPSLIENIDLIVFLTLSRLKGSYVRRTDNILEVTGVSDNRPDSVNVFSWEPSKDEYQVGEKSVVLKKIAKRLGLPDQNVQEELIRRKKILEWMLEREVYDYRDVARIISTYYTDPERVMSAVGL